ncbi:AI-2E family transporter [Parvularcula sp. LCG005]|uniref:AI-2E family transporter n=1 Tax=Parvularcula sp. LCG005 TaxID=3078805 RepID=UPI00294315BF|nr:AI-2E family transporter [Parvularcula sp. LCG005]WOI52435.1 AI-2E family transporter [Parvularcula sp. LCG005]
MTDGNANSDLGNDTSSPNNSGPLGGLGKLLTIRHSWALVAVFLIVAVAAIIQARALLMPILFAFLLAITFAPIRRGLNKAKIPSSIAAAVIVLSLIGVLVLGIIGLSAPVRSYMENAPDLIAQVEQKLTSVSSTMESVSKVGKEMEKLTPTDSEEDVVVMKQPGPLAKFATGAPLLLGQIILTLALLYFILASGDMFYEKTVHAIPSFADKRRAVQIFRDIENKLSRYFLTITVINIGLGVVTGLALHLCGMPNAALFGAMAFVFNYVPYLGAVAGTAIVSMVGVLTYDTVSPAIGVGFLFWFLTAVEGQFVTPVAVGKSLKLNTVVVFLAVAFWGWAWSVIGMIIAMPTLIALRAFSEHVPKLRPLGTFLSARHAEMDDPPRTATEPEPAAQTASAV